MAEFASHLDVTQASVSRFESGKLAPGTAALLGYYRLARKPQHKAEIRKLLGVNAAILDKEDRFEVAVKNATEQLNAARKDIQISPHSYERLNEIVVAFVEDPDGIPLWLFDLTHTWFEVKGDQKARRDFEDLVHAAARRIKVTSDLRSAKR